MFALDFRVFAFDFFDNLNRIFGREFAEFNCADACTSLLFPRENAKISSKFHVEIDGFQDLYPNFLLAPLRYASQTQLLRWLMLLYVKWGC